MRVVIFGGFIDYELQLGKELSKLADVFILLPVYNLSQEILKSIEPDVKYYTFEDTKPNNYLDKIRNIYKTLRKLHQYKPDIVHLQIGGDVVDFMLFLYCRFLRIPTVITYHDVSPHLGEKHPYIVTVARFVMRKCSNAIIVHGKKLREQMIIKYRLPAEKIYSVHIGEHEVAPFKVFERPEITEDKNSILFFGRIYEYKGLEYLIKSEPMITEKVPGCKIIIAGQGENFEKYDNMIGTRKEHFIIYNHLISYKDGAELFQRSSVVVLPYVEASQSGVIPTAYSFKKPVVVTNVGSIPEVVDDGKTGLIVPPRDSRALAEAIIIILNDDKLRKEMGENAFIKLKEDFSWKNIGKQTFDIYKNVLVKK